MFFANRIVKEISQHFSDPLATMEVNELCNIVFQT